MYLFKKTECSMLLRICDCAFSKYFIFYIFFFFLTIETNGQFVYTLDDGMEDQKVTDSSIGLYQDSSMSLTFKDILTPEIAGQFSACDINSRIRSDKINYWAKFSLTGNALKNRRWYVEMPDWHTRYIDFYILQKDGTWEKTETGSYRSSKSKKIDHKNFIFRVPQDMDTVNFILKKQSDMRNPFLFRVRSDKFIFEYATKEYLSLGIFYGLLFIMIIYNLLLFVLRQEKVSLAFCFYVLSSAFLCTAEDGLAFQYLWPSCPNFNHFNENYAPYVFLISFVMSPKTERIA